MSKTANVSFTLPSEMKEKSVLLRGCISDERRGKEATDISSIQYMVKLTEKQHIECVGEILYVSHTSTHLSTTTTLTLISHSAVLLLFLSSIYFNITHDSELSIFINIIQMMSIINYTIMPSYQL